MNESTFHVEREYIKSTKFGFWVFAFFTALSLGTSLIPSDDGEYRFSFIVVMLMCASGFGALTFYYYKALKSMSCFSVCIDEDGLWYAHKSKSDGLIPWSKVKAIKQKTVTQKLCLRDGKGKELINLHHHLEGFHELRNKLIENIRANYPGSIEPIFAKGIGYHLFSVFVIVTFIALTVFAYSLSAFLFWSMVVVVLACLHEYCFDYYKIFVSNSNLVTKSILRTKSYPLKNIQDVVMLEIDGKATLVPALCVKFTDDSSLRLTPVGREATEICIILKNLLTAPAK